MGEVGRVSCPDPIKGWPDAEGRVGSDALTVPKPPSLFLCGPVTVRRRRDLERTRPAGRPTHGSQAGLGWGLGAHSTFDPLCSPS
jgi:hypothetical protein